MQNKTVVILVNTGSPSAPTAAALKPYLRDFLSDPRIIELPRWFWLPILNGIILRKRPAQSAQRYQKIWMPENWISIKELLRDMPQLKTPLLY